MSTDSTFLLKTAFYPQACLLCHPTGRELLQEVCSDLHQHHSEASKTQEWIWQPTSEMEKRVLIAQFPAGKNVCWHFEPGVHISSFKEKKKKKKNEVIWPCLDYFHFQTVLGRKMGEFHWPELTFNFFHVFWIFLPCLGFIHSCRQVKTHRIYLQRQTWEMAHWWESI